MLTNVISSEQPSRVLLYRQVKKHYVSPSLLLAGETTRDPDKGLLSDKAGKINFDLEYIVKYSNYTH